MTTVLVEDKGKKWRLVLHESGHATTKGEENQLPDGVQLFLTLNSKKEVIFTTNKRKTIWNLDRNDHVLVERTSKHRIPCEIVTAVGSSEVYEGSLPSRKPASRSFFRKIQPSKKQAKSEKESTSPPTKTPSSASSLRKQAWTSGPSTPSPLPQQMDHAGGRGGFDDRLEEPYSNDKALSVFASNKTRPQHSSTKSCSATTAESAADATSDAKTMSSYKAKLRENEERIADLEKQLEEGRMATEDYEKKVNRLAGEKKELEQQLEERKGQILRLTGEVNRLQEARCEDGKTRSLREVKFRENEERMQRHLEERQMATEEYKKIIKQLADEKSELEQQLEGYNEQVLRLRSEVSTLTEAFRVERVGAFQVNRELQSQVFAAEKALEEQNKGMAMLAQSARPQAKRSNEDDETASGSQPAHKVSRAHVMHELSERNALELVTEYREKNASLAAQLERKTQDLHALEQRALLLTENMGQNLASRFPLHSEMKTNWEAEMVKMTDSLIEEIQDVASVLAFRRSVRALVEQVNAYMHKKREDLQLLLPASGSTTRERVCREHASKWAEELIAGRKNGTIGPAVVPLHFKNTARTDMVWGAIISLLSFFVFACPRVQVEYSLTDEQVQHARVACDDAHMVHLDTPRRKVASKYAAFEVVPALICNSAVLCKPHALPLLAHAQPEIDRYREA